MADKINFIISATDETKAALQSASGGLDGLAKAAGVAMNALIALAAAGLAALGAGLKFAIGEAMEAEEVMAQLDAVLRSTGGAAGITAERASELADSLALVTKFSDEAALAAETMLLRFDNIGADIFPQALSAAADLATALGTDLTAAAQTVGKALDDPANGIGRLNTALKLFTPEQEAAIKAMAEAGDVAGAQAAILDGLAKSVGGAAIAAGQTAAGQFEIFKNKLSNVAEEVGMKLLPVLGQLGDIVFPVVLSAAESLVPVFEDVAGAIDTFITASNNGLAPLDALTVALAGVLPDDVFTDFLDLKIALEGLGDDFKKAFDPTVETSATNLSNAMSNIMNLLKTDGPAAAAGADSLGTSLGKLSGMTLNTLTGSLETLTLLLSGDIIGGIENFVQTAIDNFNTLGANISIAPDMSAWTGVFDQVGIIISALKDKVGLAIQGAIDKAKDAAKIGKAMIDGIAGAVIAAAQSLIDALVSAVMQAIDAAKAAAGIESPSKLTEHRIGLPIIQGVAAGISRGAHLPAQALVTATSHAVLAAQNAYNTQNVGIYGPMNLNVQGGQAGAADLLQSLADMGAVA